jgi:opacity protein-like surface antigen
MNKISIRLSLVTFLLTAVNLNAQDLTDRINVGFKISPNFSWLKMTEGDIMKNDDVGLGFSYGLTGDYRFTASENYFIGADILISTAPVNLQHGGKLQRKVADTTQVYENVGFRYSTQYFQIPVYLKLKTNEIGGMKYHIDIGLGTSFTLSKKLATKVGAGNTSVYTGTNNTSHDPNSTETTRYEFDGGKEENKQFSYQDDISSLRMSLILGAGIEYPLAGNTRFTAGLRFDNGFTDFLSDNAYSGRHNFISLSAGILF